MVKISERLFEGNFARWEKNFKFSFMPYMSKNGFSQWSPAEVGVLVSDPYIF